MAYWIGNGKRPQELVMAQIRLKQRETDREYLPEVCMACGQPSATHIRKTFAWHPPWVIVLILVNLIVYAVVALIMTKRMTVEVPVCEKHRGYWWKRYLLMILPLPIIVALGIGLMIALDQPGQGNLSGMACAGTAGLGLVWLISVAVIQSMMIRAKEITDRTITLTRVNDEFVAALDEVRRRERPDDWDDEGDEYEERLRRRRRREQERAGHSDDAPPDKRDAFRAERGDDSIREPGDTSFREEPPRRRPTDE
jgi:hypothetical protein